ncbi:MAG: InlB B-repeat-containing protein [Clostridia bacterium]|nr:InlB B-repeat-containing protein [Clostridia bacterium]
MHNTKRIFFSLFLLAVAVILPIFSAGCKDGGSKKNNTQYTVGYYESAEATEPFETRTFTHGDNLTVPVVNREGYETLWTFYDENGTELGNTGKVTRNMKVVATYVTKDCLVTVYNSYTGEVWLEDYYPYGYKYTPTFETEIPGLIFKGYRADSSEEYKTEFELKDSQNICAVYEAILYKITFLDDVTNRVIYSTSNTVYGNMTLPSAPEKDGYTFDGWYYVEGFNVVRAGGKGNSFSVTKDIDFYAVYTKADAAE